MIDLDYVKEFAKNAHQGQVRKYTGEPYVEHCYAVADMVQKLLVDADDVAVCAAYLHDTVEDTEVTYDDIISEFGEKVASYVWYLTKPENFVGNRATRKSLDRARLGCAPDIVKAIKTLDLMHNAQSIREYDSDFWETFREEVILLLDAMQARHVWFKLVKPEYYYDYDDFIDELING